MLFIFAAAHTLFVEHGQKDQCQNDHQTQQKTGKDICNFHTSHPTYAYRNATLQPYAQCLVLVIGETKAIHGYSTSCQFGRAYLSILVRRALGYNEKWLILS